MTIEDMARIASDGTEELTKMRWQFQHHDEEAFSALGIALAKNCQSLWCPRRGGPYRCGFLEDDRLQVLAISLGTIVAGACWVHDFKQCPRSNV